jgi:acetyl esterase/lipase
MSLPRFLVLACLAWSVLTVPAAAGTGDVNTGQPGSTCQPTANGNEFTPSDDPGVSTGQLGAAAPAYYEVGEPSGAFAGAAPKGVMLQIHGGAWYVVGDGVVSASRPFADAWRDRGWRTVNLDYRGCEHSLADVVTFFDLVRAKYPGLPICATGQSAGGHLALMLAARRPGLACVEAVAAPTDLPGLEASEPTLYHRAVAAFGADRLEELSPVSNAGQISARVLQGIAVNDQVVPPRQPAELDGLLTDTYSDTRILEGGEVPFIHGKADRTAVESFARRELNLVAPITGDAPGECDLCGAGEGWSMIATDPTPAGSLLELTAVNDVVTTSGATSTGSVTATIDYSDTAAAVRIPGGRTTLPAGTWRLQTCWGAAGPTFAPWNRCIERTVTTMRSTSQESPAKDIAAARVGAPYNLAFYVNVDRMVGGQWQPYARSWQGNVGSRFRIPARGAAVV